MEEETQEMMVMSNSDHHTVSCFEKYYFIQ